MGVFTIFIVDLAIIGKYTLGRHRQATPILTWVAPYVYILVFVIFTCFVIDPDKPQYWAVLSISFTESTYRVCWFCLILALESTNVSVKITVLSLILTSDLYL
jgi:hypothetical protein